MKKATWRFRSMAHEAARVLATAPTLEAAARELQVDVSTLHGWIGEGKLERPTPGQRPAVNPTATPQRERVQRSGKADPRLALTVEITPAQTYYLMTGTPATVRLF